MKKTLKGMITLMIVMYIAIICNVSVLAANKRVQTEKNYAFAVPEGGWSSCKVNIIYEEEYTPTASGTRNSFFHRTKWYTGKYEYATSCPTLKVQDVVYKNSDGKVVQRYSSWTREVGIYPGVSDILGYYSNSEKIELSATTKYTGQLNYTVSLYGANPSAYIKYISMKLNTK